jgi:hypothetical protein
MFFQPQSLELSTSTDGVNLTAIGTLSLRPVGDTPQDLLDFFSDLTVNCYLFPHQISCSVGNQPQPMVIPIEGFTPVGFASYSVDPAFGNAVYIASTTGDVYYLPLNTASQVPTLGE